MARHRAKVEAAAREADFLRSSVTELSKLDPQPGEETELAEMRASMMRVEKIASEIKDAQDTLSGANSPLPQLASLLRRLQRKAPDVPGLLDDVVKSLDDALISLDAAQSGVDAALRATEYDPQRLGAGGGAAVRIARRRPQAQRRGGRPCAAARCHGG